MIKKVNHSFTDIKCVFIDVDNTLLDFEKSSQLAIKRTCEAFNIDYSQKMFDVFLDVNNSMWRQIQDGKLTKAQLWQARWNRIFDEIGIHADGVVFENEFHRYLRNYAVPIDGAIDMLQYLHSKYTVCTASNASFEQQYHRLRLSGMLQFINKMFVSEQLGAQKPSAQFFQECFKQIEYIPSETLMIGDDIHADMLGANAYGLLTCWYNPNNLPNDENISVDIEIKNLSELEYYL